MKDYSIIKNGQAWTAVTPVTTPRKLVKIEVTEEGTNFNVSTYGDWDGALDTPLHFVDLTRRGAMALRDALYSALIDS